MSTINWIPIADCPEELKDGRTVLVWCEGWDEAEPARYNQRLSWWDLLAHYEECVRSPNFVAPMPKGPEVGRG